MAQKFTPYALTALPPVNQRDPNGVYFIRTSTGFKMYLIADTPLKTAIEVELSGVVDLISPQTIDGLKTFVQPLTIQNYTPGFPAANSSQLKLAYRKNPPAYGDSEGLYISAGGNKTFMLDMQDLASANWGQSIMRVVQLNFSEALTQLGFKRTFDLTRGITLTNPSPGSQHNVDISHALPTWDGGHALAQGMNWDIVWTSGTMSNLRYHSLKQMHAANAVWDLTIRITSTGVFLVGRLQDGATLTVPTGAKLMIW